MPRAAEGLMARHIQFIRKQVALVGLVNYVVGYDVKFPVQPTKMLTMQHHKT